MARTVIRRLVARDELARLEVVIEPGAWIESFRIHRNHQQDSEVYVMEFETDGRRLNCPLVQFQARTQIVIAAIVDESPAAVAAATA